MVVTNKFNSKGGRPSGHMTQDVRGLDGTSATGMGVLQPHICSHWRRCSESLHEAGGNSPLMPASNSHWHVRPSPPNPKGTMKVCSSGAIPFGHVMLQTAGELDAELLQQFCSHRRGLHKREDNSPLMLASKYHWQVRPMPLVPPKKFCISGAVPFGHIVLQLSWFRRIVPPSTEGTKRKATSKVVFILRKEK